MPNLGQWRLIVASFSFPFIWFSLAFTAGLATATDGLATDAEWVFFVGGFGVCLILVLLELKDAPEKLNWYTVYYVKKRKISISVWSSIMCTLFIFVAGLMFGAGFYFGKW